MAPHKAIAMFRRLLVGAQPGLENIVAAECKAIGGTCLAANGIRVRDAGVVQASLRPGLSRTQEAGLLFAMMSRLRTAEFVRVPAGEFENVEHFWQLEQCASKVNWRQFFPPNRCLPAPNDFVPGQEVEDLSSKQSPATDELKAIPRATVRAAASKSKLYHDAGIAERVELQIRTAAGWKLPDQTAKAQHEERQRVVEGEAYLDRLVMSKAERRKAARKARRQAAKERPPVKAVHDAETGVLARIHKDDLELSVNAAGPRLHKRGYRRHIYRTPLRETLAAALVRLGGAVVEGAHSALTQQEAFRDRKFGRNGRSQARLALEQGDVAFALSPRLRRVWDPFCGSGTMVMEALDAGHRLLPPLPRHFAAEQWQWGKGVRPAEVLEHLRRAGFQGQLPPTLPDTPGKGGVRPSDRSASQAAGPKGGPRGKLPALGGDPRAKLPTSAEAESIWGKRWFFLGSDVKRQAVEAARANASRAGAGRRVKFERGDFESVVRGVPHGTVIFTNPPYSGVVTESGGKEDKGGSMRALYKRFGRMLKSRPDLQHVFVVMQNPIFADATGLKWKTLATISNGGRKVKLLQLAGRR